MRSKRESLNSFASTELMPKANWNKSTRKHWNGITTDKEDFQKEIDFIKKTFQRLECVQYVREQSSKTRSCFCGRNTDEHGIETTERKISRVVGYQSNRPSIWTRESCIIERESNAFGRINFVNQYMASKPAKYVRLADTSKPKDILQLLFDHWHLPVPNLIISVTGGAKNFNLNQRDQEIFNRGLINAGQTTGAWIFTGGLNTGVVKAVGRAVIESQSLSWVSKNCNRDSLRCIGIAPWGYVDNSQCLLNKGNSAMVAKDYNVDPVVKRHSPVPLNPYHSYFLFVDNGTLNQYGGEIKLRSKLEKCLAEESSHESFGLRKPVVVLVLEGGIDCIKSVHESVSKRIPIVVFEGTGRAADLLAFAYKHTTVEKGVRFLDATATSLLIQKMLTAYPKLNEQKDSLEYLLVLIKESVADEKLVTIFKLGEGRNDELDLAILSALLKAQCTSKLDQLRLALNWNRIDVAKEKIFTEDAQWPTGSLNESMLTALLKNRVEFVKLFMENGVNIKDFLSVAKLSIIYNADGENCHVKNLLRSVHDDKLSQQEVFSLRDVGKLLKKLMGAHFEPLYLRDRRIVEESIDDNVLISVSARLAGTNNFSLLEQAALKLGGSEEQSEMQNIEGTIDVGILGAFERSSPSIVFDNPMHELFLWAVLSNRPEMALFIWENGEEVIAAALVGCKLFKAMTKEVKADSEVNTIFQENAQKFEDLACNVLDECHMQDDYLSQMLVAREMPNWGGLNCLQVAASAGAEKFISHACCQATLDEIWMKEIRSSESSVALTALLPIFIPFLSFGAKNNESNNRCRQFLDNIKDFYEAPITKFWGTVYWYIIFLGLYSYVILFSFESFPTIPEWILIFWIFTMLLELIREIAITGKFRRQQYVSQWIFTSEILSMVIAIIAVCLRWTTTTLEAARVLYCVNGAFFYAKILRFYSFSVELGPKLVMIKKMIVEVLLFLCILVVFLFGYGFVSQALLYKKLEPTVEAVFNVIARPYWQMYGDLMLATLQGTDKGCNSTSVIDNEGKPCPTNTWLVLLLLAGYMIVTNILLINLLIAVFSNVFQDVQSRSRRVWKFQRYFLVMEFKNKPVLPPPFIILSHIYMLIKRILCLNSNQVIPLSEQHIEIIRIFEIESAASYRKKAKSEANNTMNAQLQRIDACLQNMQGFMQLQHQRQLVNTIFGGNNKNTNSNNNNDNNKEEALHRSVSNFKKPILIRSPALSCEPQVAPTDANSDNELIQNGNNQHKSDSNTVNTCD